MGKHQLKHHPDNQLSGDTDRKASLFGWLSLHLSALILSGCTTISVVRPDCNNLTNDLIVTAECRFFAEDYDDALQKYRRAANTSLVTKNQAITKLQAHGESLIIKGRLLVARRYFENGLVLAHTLKDKKLISSSFTYLGEMAYRLGDYAKAKAYMEQAQPLLLQSEQPILAIRNMNNLGNTYSNLGEFDEAEKALDKALSIATQHKKYEHIAQSLNNKGGLLYNLRRYSAAIEVLDKAETNAIRARHARLQSYALLTKGVVLRQQSDFEKALKEYEAALTVARRFPIELKHEIGSIKRNTADLLIHTPHGDHQKNLLFAEKYLNEVLISHQENRIEVGLASNHLGEIELDRQNYTKAIQYFEKSLENYLSLSYPDGVGRSYINLGRAYNASSNYQQAVQFLVKANTVYTKLEDREWLRVGQYQLGLAHERLGNEKLAEQSYKTAIEHLESIRGDVHGDQAAQELFTEINAGAYERLISLLMEKGDISGALEYIERSRLRALDEYLMQGRGGTGTDTPLGGERERNVKEGQLLVQARQHREEAAKFSLVSGEDVGRLIYNVANDFQGKYKRTARKAIGLGKKSINITKLSADAAVITYFPTPKATYIIASRGDQEPVGVTLNDLNKSTLRTKVIAALDYLNSGQTLLSKQNLTVRKEDTSGKTIMTSLYEILISPINSVISNAETLIIYPHDFLVYMPFEALMSPDQKYLVENKRIVYLHSIDGESKLESLGAKKSSFSFKSAVVFADPQPLLSGQSPLIHAKDEAAKIKLSFPNSLILEGRQATKRAFQQQWGKHEIVHMATHGESSSDRTALFLARGNDDSDSDGQLTEVDISGLSRNPKKTKLIILSACETAIDAELAIVDPEDPIATLGLAGMIHLFTDYHGVPSRIGSLWKVNDAKTATLMGDMYKFMVNQKSTQTPYDAFRSAQLKMINRGGISSHPYFWAGFIYFGIP